MHCWMYAVSLILNIVNFMLVSTSGNLTSESHGKPLELMFSARTKIMKINLETPSTSVVLVDGLSNAVALDYDFHENIVVWSDVRDKGIYRARLLESADSRIEKEVLAKVNVVTPDGLAVDWIHANVYWTDTGTDEISVASLDGKMRKLLFSKDLGEPRAIVVNPLEGWMFWTDWGSNPKIERSGMDGTHRSTIISKGIAVPNGLAIDYVSRRLFFADVQHHALSSSDYDGSNVKLIYYSLANVGHPFAVDVFKDWLYWTDWRTHAVSKITVTGKDEQKVSTGSHFFPMGVRVYHRHKQPEGMKYCGEKNNECAYLCLPTPQGTAQSANFTCACPDGIDCTVTDAVTVKNQYPSTRFSHFRSNTITTKVTTGSLPASSSFTEVPTQSALESYSLDKILHEIHESVNYCSRFSGIIFGMFVILIIGISLVGFCVYKQSLKGTSAGLNFVNPLYKKQRGDQVKLESGLNSEPYVTPLI